MKPFQRVCAACVLAFGLYAQAPLSPRTTASLTGTLIGFGRTSIPNAVVTLTGPDAQTRQARVVTDEKYSFIDLKPGKYELTVSAKDYATVTEPGIELKADDHVNHAVVLKANETFPVIPDQDQYSTGIKWTTAAILVYLFSMVITRWFMIAMPSRNFLRGQIHAMKTRLVTEVEVGPHKTCIEGRLDQIQKSSLDFENWRKLKFLGQFLFWSQGTENAAWTEVHELERQMTAFLSPESRVLANLAAIAPDLRRLNLDSANAIATQIESEVAKPSTSAGSSEFRRQLLAKGIELLYRERDKFFSTMMDWQNKATWLLFIGCLLSGLVAAKMGHGFLLVAGAAGGLLSRLMRSLQRADVPIDYGASWTTLFLSPLLGALAGWFGVAIITVLARPEIALLGSAFSVVNWDEPLRVATIAVACVLGVSERLFNSLVDVLERQTARAGSAAAPQALTPSSPILPVSTSILPGGSPTPLAAQPGFVAGQPAAAVDALTQINQAIATALTAGASSIPVVQFLKGMGIQVSDGTSGNDLLSLVRTLGLKAATDPSVRSAFVSEARKAGLG